MAYVPGQETLPRGARIQPKRVGELVAQSLREQILSGELPPGTRLPTNAVLAESFSISPASMREAMRILENDGLITVRRGSTGGAVVHAPTENDVARTLALVLQSSHTPFSDVRAAILATEPAAARMCAERKDRRRAVVPVLRKITRESEVLARDARLFVNQAFDFHRGVIELSGNQTLRVVLIALDALREGPSEALSRQQREAFPESAIQDVITSHVAIIDAIADGDGDRAAELLAEHLRSSRSARLSGDAPIAFTEQQSDGLLRLNRVHRV